MSMPPPGPTGRSTGLWTAIAVAAVLVLVVGILVLQRARTDPTSATAPAGSRTGGSTTSATATTEVRPGGPDGVPPEATDPTSTNPTSDPATPTTTTPGPTPTTPAASTTGIPTPSTEPSTPANPTTSADTRSTTTRATTTSSPPRTTPPPPPTPLTPLAPAEQLAAWRAESLRGLTLDGRWVIQLASKYDGVVDPRQIAANGTHTFGLADIVAEISALRADPRYAGQRFLVLAGTDFDSNRRYAAPLWITLIDPGGLSTRTATLTWCRMKNPGMDDSALLNICYPRQLVPVG